MSARCIRTRVLFLLPLLLLVGCFTEEDSITITKDGAISFESTVTVPDEENKLEFSKIDQMVTGVVDELREKRWKAQSTWISKKAPYQLKVSGSGKLSEVIGTTRFYELTPAGDNTFRIYFRTPQNEGEKISRHISFQTAADGKSFVYTSTGKAVTQISDVTDKTQYTIMLK